MPTYTNTGTDIINLAGYNFPPGESTAVPIYVSHDDLTLAAHTPRHYLMKKIYDAAIAATPITSFPKYKSIMIKNISGDVLTLTVNADATDQVFKLEANEIWTIDRPEYWGHVVMSGSGGGNVRIYGSLL